MKIDLWEQLLSKSSHFEKLEILKNMYNDLLGHLKLEKSNDLLLRDVRTKKLYDFHVSSDQVFICPKNIDSKNIIDCLFFNQKTPDNSYDIINTNYKYIRVKENGLMVINYSTSNKNFTYNYYDRITLEYLLDEYYKNNEDKNLGDFVQDYDFIMKTINDNYIKPDYYMDICYNDKVTIIKTPDFQRVDEKRIYTSCDGDIYKYFIWNHEIQKQFYSYENEKRLVKE